MTTVGSLVIGLTGGVASGKSWAAKCFIALGVPLLEADDVGRAVVQAPSVALEEIRAAFGAESLLPDGSLDRAWMRQRIFSDPKAKTTLEGITHPLIRRLIREWQSVQVAPYCILSAAILVESKLDTLVQRVLVIDAPESLQIERLVHRDGISEALARKMLSAQASRNTRLQRADDVLDNSDAAQIVVAQVGRLHRLYLRIAAVPSH